MKYKSDTGLIYTDEGWDSIYTVAFYVTPRFHPNPRFEEFVVWNLQRGGPLAPKDVRQLVEEHMKRPGNLEVRITNSKDETLWHSFGKSVLHPISPAQQEEFWFAVEAYGQPKQREVVQ